MNDTISVTSSHDSAGTTIETMPPPLPNRRPRVREVSSRFLSPSLSSIPKPSHKSDETPNRKTSDTPLTSHNHKFTKKQHPQQHPNKENKNSKPRTDTPIDRIVPSRFRQNPNTNKPFNRLPPVTTAAAKLLQSNGLSLSSSAAEDFETSSVEGDEESKSLVGENSPVLTRNRTVRVVSDVTRTSMPEEEIMCNRERSCFSNASFSKMISASTCSRSLNLGQMSGMSSGGESMRLLPPHPTCIKLGGVNGRKGGNKVSCHQEDVHSLKLLYNHHLQWRYANAKAEATIRAQRVENEKKLYSFGVQVSDLRDVVKRKRMELLLLQQTKTLHTIFESHMPYLDEWSTLEEEYSTSLSGVTHALLNSLLRLPVGADVQADTIEVGEALNSAIKMMEMIGVHVQSFMPKAEEMDNLISELARVIGGEKALIEECGDLLFKTCTSQVEDCSLRGHIMQLHRSNDYQMPNE